MPWCAAWGPGRRRTSVRPRVFPGATEVSGHDDRVRPRKEESTSSEHELYDAMTELYPDWASHQAWLMFGLG